ncbi:unnamed protein product [Diatraea saccharalis]|uniref:BESS domain-containing protein n=1 Tax=Diatraea saccharalis TaxID=40085 RepID=A0A9N9WJF2_9NEOP|nr:unnamed protein product [Diatraea saccharalis]
MMVSWTISKPERLNLKKKTEDIEDPKRMFLLSLLPDMKAMSDSQTRTFKRRVLTLTPPHQVATYNAEKQGAFLSTQELPVSNEQQATPAYNNHILSYYESVPFLINTKEQN